MQGLTFFILGQIIISLNFVQNDLRPGFFRWFYKRDGCLFPKAKIKVYRRNSFIKHLKIDLFSS